MQASANKRIAVVSYKGGVAKSTTAIHLATYLGKRGKTILVDGDLNRSAIEWVQPNPDAFPFQVHDPRSESAIIDDASHSSHYTYTVVDTPARPSKAEMEVLGAYFFMLVPMPPDPMAVRATTKMLQDIQGRAFRKIQYKILLTIVPPPPSREAEYTKESLEKAGYPVFQTVIPRLSAFKKASLLGVPVYDVKEDKYAQIAWNRYVAAFQELKL